MELNQAAPTGFFTRAGTSTTNNWRNGQVGIEITAQMNTGVTSLARGLMVGTTKLSTTSRVSIWDVATKTELGHVNIGPSSSASAGYAWGDLPAVVPIARGKKYRIVQTVRSRQADKYTMAYTYGSSRASAFHSRVASFGGLVQYGSTTGYPTTSYINSNQGIGIMNFRVLENDGCGRGLWTCEANHTCTKTVIRGFQVSSGPCKLTDSDSCVTSPNYGTSNYNNNERCTIVSPSEGTMKVTAYNNERGYDYLTIDGTRYSRSTPPSMTLSASKTFHWRSDGSVTRPGFKICMQSASSLNQEEEQAPEAEAEQGTELSESQLAELPEDERQHARTKYQQARDDEKAEAEIAATVEKELAAAQEASVAEPSVVQEEEAETEAETDLDVVNFDEDDFALPDLTSAVADETTMA